MTPSDPHSELALLGSRLGAPSFCQGAGGNVSIKVGDELWVKASGLRLSDVASSAGVARVPLALARGALDKEAGAEQALFGVRPRPSLETYFHALDGAVVAHTHALGVLLAACSEDGEQRGLPGLWVPYMRPGREVAVAIAAARSSETGESVVFLRSHGVVVYAESARRAVELTEELDARAREPFRQAPRFEAYVEDYQSAEARPLEGGVVRALPRRQRPSSQMGRYLFPDAPVCATEVPVDSLRELEPTASTVLKSLGRAAVMVDPEGRRAMVGPSARAVDFGLEVVAAHDWLEDVLGPRGLARYLPEDEPARLLDLPSEQYRIQLAASRKDAC